MPPLSSTTLSSPAASTIISLTGIARLPEYQIAVSLLNALVAHLSESNSQAIPKLQYAPCCDMDYILYRRSENAKPTLVETVYPSCFTKISTSSETSYYNLETLIAWTKRVHSFHFVAQMNVDEYTELAAKEFNAQLSRIKNPIVCMSVDIDDVNAGKMYIELYRDKCPKTVAQFLSFVEEGYTGTQFNRLLQGGWIQGGEIERTGEDGQVDLVDSPMLPDENFIVRHSRRGILSMVNKGPNSGVSAFLILLASSMPYLDKKYVAFGKVIDGDTTLRNMESIETRFERPTSKISVSSIGVYKAPVEEPKKKNIEPESEDINSKPVERTDAEESDDESQGVIETTVDEQENVEEPLSKNEEREHETDNEPVEGTEENKPQDPVDEGLDHKAEEPAGEAVESKKEVPHVEAAIESKAKESEEQAGEGQVEEPAGEGRKAEESAGETIEKAE